MMWNIRNSYSLLAGKQNGTATVEDRVAVSYKTKHTVTRQSSNCASWYLPKWVKNLCPHKTSTQMFTVALFIVAKTWKQARFPSMGEWINKLCYIHTMEYYSVIKRNELSNHEKTWRKLKCILWTQWSQPEKATKLYDSNYMTFWKRQNYGDSKKISGCQGFSR